MWLYGFNQRENDWQGFARIAAKCETDMWYTYVCIWKIMLTLATTKTTPIKLHILKAKSTPPQYEALKWTQTHTYIHTHTHASAARPILLLSTFTPFPAAAALAADPESQLTLAMKTLRLMEML